MYRQKPVTLLSSFIFDKTGSGPFFPKHFVVTGYVTWRTIWRTACSRWWATRCGRSTGLCLRFFCAVASWSARESWTKEGLQPSLSLLTFTPGSGQGEEEKANLTFTGSRMSPGDSSWSTRKPTKTLQVKHFVLDLENQSSQSINRSSETWVLSQPMLIF